MKRHLAALGAHRAPRTWPRIAALFVLGAALGLLAALSWASPAYALSGAPATFAIISPVYYSQHVAEGPVGANIIVQATGGWTSGATIVLGVQSGVVGAGNTCDQASEIFAPSLLPIVVDGKGAFAGVFTWPTAAGNGPYSVCANEENGGIRSGASSNTYTVLSPNVPTVQVSDTAPHAGSNITVSGSNWLPAAQQITLQLVATGASPVALNDPSITLSDGNGNFTVDVKLPTEYLDMRQIVATMGTQTKINATASFWPIQVTSQPITIAPPLPTPTATPAPTMVPTTAAATPTVGTSSPPGTTANNQKLLIGLLGLIALILLLAGIVVAILAVRGRNDTQRGRWESPSGPRQPIQQSGSLWDETEASGPNWNEVWQNPSGMPWSGRASRPYSGPLPPQFDDEDDPYRTRTGDNSPGGPPPPPLYRQPEGAPRPPSSRPMSPRPTTLRGNNPPPIQPSNTISEANTTPDAGRWPPSPSQRP